MKLLNVDCEIDIDEVLSELDINTAIDNIDFSEASTDDDIIELIKDELSNRALYQQYNLSLHGDVTLSSFDIDSIDDWDLLNSIERKGYTVLSSESINETPLSGPPQNLFEELCNQFDLPRLLTTKQELLKHINSLL